MKRILSLFITASMIFCICAVSVSAADGVKFVLSDTEADVGATEVKVPFSVSGLGEASKSMYSFGFDFSNDERISFKSIEWTDSLNGWDTDGINAEKQKVLITTNDFDNTYISDDTILGYFVYEIPSDAAEGDEYSVNISNLVVGDQISLHNLAADNRTAAAVISIKQSQPKEATINIISDKERVVAGEEIVVSIYAKDCADFTNAIWSFTYEEDKFEYLGVGSVKTLNINIDGTTIHDKVYGDTGSDEYKADEILAEYKFKALKQAKEVTADFAISGTYLDTYTDASNQNVKPVSNNKYAQVTIVMNKNITVEPVTPDPNDPLGENMIKVEGNTLTVPYDAKEHYIIGSAKLTDGNPSGSKIIVSYSEDNLTWTTEYPKYKNAGEYTVYYKAEADGYTDASGSAKIIITRLTPEISVNYTQNEDLTNPTVNFTVTVNGFIDETYTGKTVFTFNGTDYDVSLTYNAETHTAVGEINNISAEPGKYTASAKYEQGTADNYNSAETASSLNVTVIGICEIHPEIENEYTYDGAAHGIVPETVDGWTWTLSEDIKATHVSDENNKKEVTVTYINNAGIYADVVLKVTLIINPKSIEGKVNDQTIEFGETPVHSYTADGLVDGDILDLTYTVTPDNGNIGSHNVSAVNSNTDYNADIADGTLTIVAREFDDPENPDPSKGSYLIEVVNNTFKGEGYTEDYVKGEDRAYRMIIVYTDKANLYFTYGDNTKLYDVSQAKYIYADDEGLEYSYTENYAHKFAIVIPAEYNGEAQLTPDEYRAKVKVSNDGENIISIGAYDHNVNFSTETDLNDLSAVYGVYNAREDYMINSMNVVLKSDTNNDKIVDTKDANLVKEEVINKTYVSGE
ncbi:MAG: hypothetical protein ACI4DY_06760 [Monoglobaceae bacterium]